MFIPQSTYTITKFDARMVQKAEELKMKQYKIWTDGSFTGVSTVGMGFMIPTKTTLMDLSDSDTVVPYGFEINTSDIPEKWVETRNILGEIFAMMFAVQYIRDVQKKCKIKVLYDYSGIEYWITGKWNAKNDLTKMYRAWFYSNKLQYIVDFEHVKAHTKESGNNNVADVYARNPSHGNIEVEYMPQLLQKEDVKISRLLFKKGGLEVRCDWFDELVE